MANPITDTIDVAAMKAEIATLKADVSGLLDRLRTNAATGAHAAVDMVDDNARKLYREAAVQGDATLKGLSRKIEEKPLMALLVAAGIGFIGARLLSR